MSISLHIKEHEILGVPSKTYVSSTASGLSTTIATNLIASTVPGMIEDYDRASINIDFYDSPYTVLTTNRNIFVDTASGVVSIEIPDAQCIEGRTLTISDFGGAVSTNNILISGVSTLFNNYDDIALTENFISIELLCDGTNWILI